MPLNISYLKQYASVHTPMCLSVDAYRKKKLHVFLSHQTSAACVMQQEASLKHYSAD